MRLLIFNLAVDEDDPILGFTVGWVRGLAARCERVDVITMRAGRADLPGNVYVRSLGKETGRSEASRGARFYRELVSVLRRSRPDAAFAHMSPLFAAMAGPALKARKVPLTLWYAHGRGGGRSLRMAQRFADTVVSPSRSSFPLPGPVVVTGHGIDTDLFTPGTRTAHPGFGVVSVGRLSPTKRLDVFVQAAALVVDPAMTFSVIGPVLAGDEAYAEGLRRKAQEGQGNVTFREAIDAEALVDLYGTTDSAVNVCEADSVDKSGLEAMACGVPLLTSNASLVEIVSEVEPGLAVPAGNAAALADALVRLAGEPAAARQALGMRLRELVERDHSLDRLIDLLVGDVFLRRRP